MQEKSDKLVLDKTVLESLKELQRPGRPDVVKSIVGVFLETTPEIAQQIRVALTEAKFTELGDASHSLKSSAASVGALRLSDICLLMEKSCMLTTFNCEEYLQLFEIEYAAAMTSLQNFIEENQ